MLLFLFCSTGFLREHNPVSDEHLRCFCGGSVSPLSAPGLFPALVERSIVWAYNARAKAAVLVTHVSLDAGEAALLVYNF